MICRPRLLFINDIGRNEGFCDDNDGKCDHVIGQLVGRRQLLPQQHSLIKGWHAVSRVWSNSPVTHSCFHYAFIFLIFNYAILIRNHAQMLVHARATNWSINGLLWLTLTDLQQYRSWSRFFRHGIEVTALWRGCFLILLVSQYSE